MTKYFYGTFEGNKRKDGSLDRHVTMSFDDRFVLISRKTPDEELMKHTGENAIWRVESTSKDKRNHTFYIAKPIHFFTEDEQDTLDQNWPKFYNLANALFTPIDPDEMRAAGTYIGATGNCVGSFEKTILFRLQTHFGINAPIEDVRNEIIRRFAKGEITLQDLILKSMIRIESDPKTARLKPYGTLGLGQKDRYARFTDVTNKDIDGADIFIKPYNISMWKDALPKGLTIQLVGPKMSVSIDPEQFDFELSENCKDDPEGYRWLWNWWEVTAKPKDGSPAFDISFSKDEPTKQIFNDILTRAGITTHEGHYVPVNTPDWKFDFERNNQPDFAPADTVTAHFVNGLTSALPIVYLFKKYPGRCLNASFSVVGSTAETLRILVHKTSK